MKDLYSKELERLEVLRQELRQEIGSICSDIYYWSCLQGELTTNEVRELHRYIDDLHSEIKEIREREEIIRERRLRKRERRLRKIDKAHYAESAKYWHSKN
jgi:hypothetical protein